MTCSLLSTPLGPHPSYDDSLFITILITGFHALLRLGEMVWPDNCDLQSYQKLEKEGIIVESNVPDNRRPNIYFNFTSPTPGTFIIALHYKGREKAILEMDLNIDDLLEKQKDNKHLLDLEYVQLNVPKVLGLLNKIFTKR
ncbi:hypothetical protein NUW54_g4696 [Trametes sanguinea]|uniref:Uncharacterized protein n=1 Tax=Trametes sanguinea TaxID=158606 RepID=A0ACC1Q0P1_9APHY|nr:hypothetical protein NUW54_g4696 [Trametes sanguinea]